MTKASPSRRLRRILGYTLRDAPLWEKNPAGSALIYGAMGSWKTTSVSVPAIMSLLADTEQALFINDVKDGEIAHQIAEMCLKYGRKFGVVDPFHVMGRDYPYRIELNAFGSVQDAAANSPKHLPIAVEALVHAIIEEPSNDKRNEYWRQIPREFQDLAIRILLRHKPELVTPGALYAFLADPNTWHSAIELEAQDPTSPVQFEAQQAIEMRDHNPEHYSQHLRAALTALRLFASGPLHEAGRHPDLTHAELVRDNWVVCFVNPVRYADRLGQYFAQHFLSLMHAQLTGRYGAACWVLDEYCSAPLMEAVRKITVFRAFQLKVLYLTQSRQDSVRKYGERETAILEENCAVKQWLKFSNFEEAERVSKAIGDTINVSYSIGLSSERDTVSANLNTGKDRLFTPDELMSLPPDEQIIHVADVGFIHCKKVRQNEIAPYCFDLAENPLEGGRLQPDPKVTLSTSPPPPPDGNAGDEWFWSRWKPFRRRNAGKRGGQ